LVLLSFSKETRYKHRLALSMEKYQQLWILLIFVFNYGAVATGLTRHY